MGLKLANKLHHVIIRFLLAKSVCGSLEGWKQKHKLTALIVLYYLTLTNKHAMIQMGSLHDLARTETILVWKPLSANTASYHSSSTRLMRTQSLNSQRLLCLWAAGLLAGLAQIILMPHLFFAALKPRKQRWSLFWDTYTGPKIPNYLVYLDHMCSLVETFVSH